MRFAFIYVPILFCFCATPACKENGLLQKKLKHAFIFYDTEDLDCNSELPEKCKYTGYCSLGSYQVIYLHQALLSLKQ